MLGLRNENFVFCLNSFQMLFIFLKRSFAFKGDLLFTSLSFFFTQMEWDDSLFNFDTLRCIRYIKMYINSGKTNIDLKFEQGS